MWFPVCCCPTVGYLMQILGTHLVGIQCFQSSPDLLSALWHVSVTGHCFDQQVICMCGTVKFAQNQSIVQYSQTWSWWEARLCRKQYLPAHCSSVFHRKRCWNQQVLDQVKRCGDLDGVFTLSSLVLIVEVDASVSTCDLCSTTFLFLTGPVCWFTFHPLFLGLATLFLCGWPIINNDKYW